MYRRLLITGSQLWTETTMIRDALAQVWHPDTIMMSGACPRGADTLCESCWTHSGGRVDRYPAQWYQGGRFRLGAVRCLAFVLDNSPGASHTVDLARRAGIWTTVYRANTTSVTVPVAGTVDVWSDLAAAGL